MCPFCDYKELNALRWSVKTTFWITITTSWKNNSNEDGPETVAKEVVDTPLPRTLNSTQASSARIVGTITPDTTQGSAGILIPISVAK
jgi:hypothetical protein